MEQGQYGVNDSGLVKVRVLWKKKLEHVQSFFRMQDTLEELQNGVKKGGMVNG